jgi:DNA-binding NarL/FixJ family response regulator
MLSPDILPPIFFQWKNRYAVPRYTQKRSGWTVKRREKKLPRVLRLLKRGKTITEIAKKLGVARSTVDDWTKKHTR